MPAFVPASGAVALLLTSSVAGADVQHTIARGHTIEAIANRYHVPAKTIIEANRLKDVKHLRVGDVLTIPGVKSVKEKTDGAAKGKAGDAAKAPASKPGEPKKPEPREARNPNVKGGKGDKADKIARADKPGGRETTTFSMKPKTPGVVHVHRMASAASEDVDVRISDGRGKVPPAALKSFEKVMRAPGGMAHPIDARLISMLGAVSNHFGSRKIELVSGFRPFTPGQFNPHSNHMHGKAIDFRVAGVPNEAVRDFCRTLKNVGCGYYPNSVFVHMDVREQNAFWIDYSKPGEPPRYNAPNVEADEGTSDVQSDVSAATGSGSSSGSAPAPDAPAEEPSSGAPEATPQAAPEAAPQTWSTPQAAPHTKTQTAP